MYTTLLAAIKTKLESVPGVQLVSTTPRTNVNTYPYIFFYPAGYTNNFETKTENSKVYRFTCILYVGTEGTTLEHAYGTVLPATVDAIITALDAGWDGGTIGGHRVQYKLDTIDDWSIEESQNGQICIAPLSLEIKLLSNI